MTRTIRAAIIVAASLVAASCGGNDDADATDAVATEDGTQAPPTTAEPDPTPTTDAADVPATTVPAAGDDTGGVDDNTDEAVQTADEDPADTPAGPQFVTAALEAAPNDDGWPMPAGQWASSAFEPAIGFTTTIDLTVLRESPSAMFLTAPGTNAWITLVSPLNVFTTDGPQAPPADVAEFLESLPNAEIVNRETLDSAVGPVTVVDAVVRSSEGVPSETCPLGAECLAVMAAISNEIIYALDGNTTRFATVQHDGGPIIAIASAVDEAGFETVAGEVAAIMTSITTADATDDPAVRFLSSLGSRDEAIPPGTYVTHLGTSTAILALDEPTDDLRPVFVGSSTAFFVTAGIGTLALLEPTGFIDPTVEQTADEPPTPDEFLLEGPGDAAEFETWLGEMVTILDTGETEIGGHPATWWDITVDDTVSSTECGPNRSAPGVDDARCVNMMSSDLIWFAGDHEDARMYWVDEADVVIDIGSFAPDQLDAVLAAAEPLFDALTLEPVS